MVVVVLDDLGCLLVAAVGPPTETAGEDACTGQCDELPTRDWRVSCHGYITGHSE
jgi:hypothetical protein